MGMVYHLFTSCLFICPMVYFRLSFLLSPANSKTLWKLLQIYALNYFAYLASACHMSFSSFSLERHKIWAEWQTLSREFPKISGVFNNSANTDTEQNILLNFWKRQTSWRSLVQNNVSVYWFQYVKYTTIQFSDPQLAI